MVQHLNGRLCFDNVVADQRTDGNQNPAQRQPCQFLAKVGANGCKPDIGTAQKQHQPNIGIPKADDDALDLQPMVAVGQPLENQKHPEDRHQ